MRYFFSCASNARNARVGTSWARHALLGLTVLALVVIGAACIPPTEGQATTPNPYFCNRVKDQKIFVSQGAQMYCFGPQTSTGTAQQPKAPNASSTVIPANVAASNLAEDVAPNGTRGYGQSETSVAANGPYVVEAWNDATTFFSPCGSPQYKEEATGFAFRQTAVRPSPIWAACPTTTAALRQATCTAAIPRSRR